MTDTIDRARQFLLTHGRLLECRLFATLFDGQSPGGVVDAVAAYRNPDGGFGYALEPDTRCPDSLPIYVETALQALLTATADVGPFGRAQELARGAADYLVGVAASMNRGGAVPLATPVIESYPRAAHWTDWTYQPGLNPTAGLAGLLYALGIEHPWRDDATAWCWTAIERLGTPDDPHTLAEMLVFLDHVPDRDRADRIAGSLAEHLSDIPGVHLDPGAEGYGLSPLQFAPTADARWRRLFSDAQIDADLERLAADQQDDGGWPITWEPPGQVALFEWRGVATVGALRTLRSYGRIERDG